MKKERTAPEFHLERREMCREMTLQKEPVLRWRLTWPVLDGTWRGLKKIGRFYEHRRRAWQERWEREVYLRACLDLARRREEGLPFRVWEAELETCVTWEGEDGILSLWQEGRERWGYDRPLALRAGDTWSLAEGAPRTLASFFPGRRRWKRELLSRVERQAAERLESGESLLDPDCAGRLRREFSEENFYLTDEGAEVFFPLYSLAPGGEGIPAFCVPLDAHT